MSETFATGIEVVCFLALVGYLAQRHFRRWVNFKVLRYAVLDFISKQALKLHKALSREMPSQAQAPIVRPAPAQPRIEMKRPAPAQPRRETALEMAGVQSARFRPFGEIWDFLLYRIDHIIVDGSTDAGKTYFGRALQISCLWAGYKTIYISPKGTVDDHLPAPIVGFGRNFEEIQETVDSLEKEMKIRGEIYAKQGKAGIERRGKLRIFWDEYLSCLMNCPNPEVVRRVFVNIAQEGRSYGMSLVVFVQGANCDQLGVPKPTRRNFAYIALAQTAVLNSPQGFVWRPNERPAICKWYYDEKTGQPFDSNFIKLINEARHPFGDYYSGILPAGTGEPAGTSSRPGAALIELGTGQKEAQFDREPAPEPAPIEGGNRAGIETRAIELMLKDGCSANQIYQVIGGRRAETLAKIRLIAQELGIRSEANHEA